MLCLCVFGVKIVFGLVKFVPACSFFIYEIWFLDLSIQLRVDFIGFLWIYLFLVYCKWRIQVNLWF